MPGAVRLPLPRCGKEEQHGRGIEQQRNHENEPSEDRLVVGADERRQIPHRAQVGLDRPPLAVDRGLLDFQVGQGLRLNRELVGKAVALGLPPFVVCGDGRGVKRCTSLTRRPCLPNARTSALVGG